MTKQQQQGLLVGIGIFLGILTGEVARALGVNRWPSVAIAGIASVVITGIGMMFVRRRGT